MSSHSNDYKVKKIFHNLKMAELWKKIKFARESKGITQQQLGDACKPKVSRSAVAQWESPPTKKKKATKPKYENLVTISEMTGKPLSWFLSDETDFTEIKGEPDTVQTEQQSLAGLIEKNIINKLSPKSRDLLVLIQQAIEENRLTDDMATEMEGYLKIKLSESKSNKDKEKKFNDLKERLLKAQDDTNHGTDNDR